MGAKRLTDYNLEDVSALFMGNIDCMILVDPAVD